MRTNKVPIHEEWVGTFCISIFFSHPEEHRPKCLTVEGDQGIKVSAFAVYRLICGKQDDNERDTDEKAPYAEYCGEYQ